MAHVAEVKRKAEDTVLIGCRRIGEEIERVPKAAGRPAKIITQAGKNKSGRHALARAPTLAGAVEFCVHLMRSRSSPTGLEGVTPEIAKILFGLGVDCLH